MTQHMKKTTIALFYLALYFCQPTYSQKVEKGDFKVTIAYLENMLNKEYTKRQIDDAIPSYAQSWEVAELVKYNPITNAHDKISHRYFYTFGYRKLPIKVKYEVENDSGTVNEFIIVTDGYDWLDEWMTAGNNIKPNGYKVDIYKLLIQELIQEGYTAGQSGEFGPGIKGYYNKPNCRVELFYNLKKPIISLTLTKTN